MYAKSVTEERTAGLHPLDAASAAVNQRGWRSTRVHRHRLRMRQPHLFAFFRVHAHVLQHLLVGAKGCHRLSAANVGLT